MASFQTLLLLSGLAVSPAAADAPRPQRIVSMNQCTDLLLLMLVKPERIASISFISRQPQWTPPEFASEIARLPLNHGGAEKILTLRPDLVVTARYSGTQTVQTLRRLGHKVVEFDAENSFQDIRSNIRKMGELVGEPARADEIVAAFDARLARIEAQAPRHAGVFANVGVNGWMSGSGTLVADAANAAGYQTLGQKLGVKGYANLSLEQIIAAHPDVVAMSSAWTHPPSEATDAMRHPAFKALGKTATFVDIPDRLTICGSPDILDAVDMIAHARP